MVAQLIDGKRIAQKILDGISTDVAELKEKNQRIPGLAVILIGNDPASEIYVQKKNDDCKQVGFHSVVHRLSSTTTENHLLALIDDLNNEPSIDGILVQLPLPSHINSATILDHIDPDKDVDGFHPYNIGSLALRIPKLRPCTPFGIIKMLDEIGVDCKGKSTTIVGASNIVGRPMALEMLLAGSTVTICHRFTQNLKAHVEQADILIVAVGKAGIVNSQWIKEGSIVIDVGIHRDENKKLSGDLDFEPASKRAAWITPVPGGVGPMTRAMLLHNTMQAYHLRNPF